MYIASGNMFLPCTVGFARQCVVEFFFAFVTVIVFSFKYTVFERKERTTFFNPDRMLQEAMCKLACKDLLEPGIQNTFSIKPAALKTF